MCFGATLCKSDLRKGDLFVLSWASVRRVRWGRISSELIMCGRGVRSILLLPLVARCLKTIDICIWRMFVVMSVVVIAWGSAMSLLSFGNGIMLANFHMCGIMLVLRAVSTCS